MKTQIELYGKLPFFGALAQKKEVNIDFENMEIESKEGLKNIPIYKVCGAQLFFNRYLIPILLIAVFVQLGLAHNGMVIGAVFYVFLSVLSGIFYNYKHQNMIVSLFAIPLPLFFLYISLNEVDIDFNIYELQGSMYATIAGLMLLEYLFIDILYRKFNDIYRTSSHSNFIILFKEPTLKKVIIQKLIITFVSVFVLLLGVTSLAAEKASAVIFAQKNAEAKALIEQKMEKTKKEKRIKVCQKLDKKLKNDPRFVQVLGVDVALYGKHWEDDSILDYDVINVNAGTRLINIRTGEIHNLPLGFHPQHEPKGTVLKIQSDRGRVFNIAQHGCFGITKTYVNQEKQIAGNYWHIEDGGEEFAIITRQNPAHSLFRVEQLKLLKD